ncbi:MAG: flagellar motor protein MotB [Alphaproteobacteria bacterium]|jgi:chemotaxis protein MotB|nr:OmpA family protein [Alphaproteobacteria bacterium]
MNKSPVIIKKVIKKGHGGHHGGAWKVAYADFVTAMMAFFLLMWLLNATTEEQKRGLSNYFGPAGDALGAGGSGGVLGGLSIETQGNFRETRASSPITTESTGSGTSATDNDSEDNDATHSKTGESGESDASLKSNKTGDMSASGMGQSSEPNFESTDTLQGDGFNKNDAKDIMEDYEKELFKEAEESLKKAVKEDPNLKDIADNLKIDQTPEGLRIQIIDQGQFSMFPSGSAVMLPKTKEILKQVVKAVQKLPNKISISGHTDAKPYAASNGYTNWELSTDRANSARRELIEDGLFPDRIMSVVGRADREPLLPASPESDQNRRLSIVLLKEPPHAKNPSTSGNGKGIIAKGVPKGGGGFSKDEPHAVSVPLGTPASGPK